MDVSSDEVNFEDSDYGNRSQSRQSTGNARAVEARKSMESPIATRDTRQEDALGERSDSTLTVDFTNLEGEEPSDTSSDDGTDEDQIPPKKPKEPVVQVPARAHHTRKSTVMRDLKSLNTEDMIPTPRKSRESKRAPDSDLSGTSKRRSLTRNAIDPKKVNYDLRHHSIDQTTRPSAPTTRKASHEYDGDEEDEEADDEDSFTTPTKRVLRRRGGKKTNYDMTAHSLDPLFQTKPSSRKSTSSIADSLADDEASNPFLEEVAPCWESLAMVDKLIHDLQEGAPDESNALPLRWREVVTALIEEGHFTRKQFNRWGGIHDLKERYEKIRQAVQGKYADDEPRDKDDRRLYFQEGFDVFDLEGHQCTYVNENIPEYMRGIKHFTGRDLAMFEKEFNKAWKNMATSTQDNSTSGASATQPKVAQSMSVTLGEPEDSDVEQDNALQSEMSEMDGHMSNEDVEMEMNEHYSQQTPHKIILSGTVSASRAATESPSANRKGKTVAPIASMVPPLTKAELDARSVEATEAFVNGSPMAEGTPSSGSFIDTLLSGSDLAPSQQLLTKLQKVNTADGGNVPGLTRKQPRGRKGKDKPGSIADFQIHEDVPGNTPRSENRRRNAVTLEMLKENIAEEYDGNTELATRDAEAMLNRFRADYDRSQARVRDSGTANVAGDAAGMVEPNPHARSSPDPRFASTPVRDARGSSDVIPSIEDGRTAAAVASGGRQTRSSQARSGQTRSSQRGFSVVIERMS